MNIYFGLGTNLGNRLENLSNAVEKLKLIGEITNSSNIYETEAWGGVPQPDYLNMCVKVKTEKFIEPLEILKTVKNFEVELGREKNIRWGARKIDIDILLIDDVIYKSEELNIPHINIPDRLFVLVPLREILPDEWRHPENNMKVDEMIENLKNEKYPVKVMNLI
ncbi:MAG: 2-amino-4-hydroxy-6-hydroxymethyldihydropteridine diphosphokinase [Synergistaceae bacterium]|nr:2-amino-4-hydroxy-6-hydroxymethyldihydropteridine diphosphokinase [Synergistaceae bacterium]MBQ6435068.1 2-amino-4-hydroxy-6-hydroxymethyldihydropteridine diphosphokinase [Synergistaceae bacterium]MBR0075839.1 2-amino-4-hydroxy-6-hydroxymethyldihydropteridine diphosphokinase [Synergistaceae bacterium]MBR0080412.1 2-amino-4-hydroxy-6-hydroxymethyldihydropteridine diphosphokinase [Synergistaceae bacterium]MBR0233506.1 2-amino-4-hydroxy-6-hydroxymethyldihydropteridine diphosphokinase [Synergist